MSGGGFSSSQKVSSNNKTINGSGFVRLIKYGGYYQSSHQYKLTVDDIVLLSGSQIGDVEAGLYIPFAKSIKLECLYEGKINSRGSLTAHVVLF